MDKCQHGLGFKRESSKVRYSDRYSCDSNKIRTHNHLFVWPSWQVIHFDICIK